MAKMSRTSLLNNYHPDAVEHILSKSKGKNVTKEEAEAGDQEWAAGRLANFKPKASTSDFANLMKEAPLGAPTNSGETQRVIKDVSENPVNQIKATEPDRGIYQPDYRASRQFTQVDHEE
jgi:hypothetical protein